MLEHISEVESLNVEKPVVEFAPLDEPKVFVLDTEINKPVPKINVVGQNYYGQFFERYHRIGEIIEFVPEFKEFYYEEKIKDPKCGLLYLLQTFNKLHVYPKGKQFHPYPSQVKLWTTKWNKEINEKRIEQGLEVIPRSPVRQIIKTRDEGNEVVLGGNYDHLEEGTKTLAGELLNDALQTMKDTQELEDVYTTEELVKRKSYVLNVLAHTTRLVHGKAALMLKASEEKRNTASFLMDLLAKASSGKMTPEEMEMLKIPYANKQPVESN